MTARSRLEILRPTIEGMRDILLSQTRSVDVCLHLLNEAEGSSGVLPSGDADVMRVVKPLVHMVGISGHSMLKLTDELGLGAKDAYPIARGIIEGAVNVAYIMASDPDVARKATRHAEVRAYRDLHRDGEMGGQRWSVGFTGQLLPAEVQRLDAMLPEFLTAKGREKGWTDLSLRQRLDAAGVAFPGTALLSLNVSAFNIYRHASEVMHGSYYGALMIWGLTAPCSALHDGEDLSLTFADHQFTTLMSAIFAFAGLVECFAQYAGVPQLKAGVDDALARLAALPAVAEAMNDGQSPAPERP